jgi:IS30 family transposase
MSNQHLTHEERSTIASLKRKNRSNTEIAAHGGFLHGVSCGGR